MLFCCTRPASGSSDTGLGELMGGALIGGTIDSTGAVTVAGTALGEA
ncbi:hypothetical protein [Butyrivibrio sp. AE2032]|nr:hypothetical protein [Butyrivibrio sp. AE2032]